VYVVGTGSWLVAYKYCMHHDGAMSFVIGYKIKVISFLFKLIL